MDGLAREPAIFSEERDRGPQELTGCSSENDNLKHLVFSED